MGFLKLWITVSFIYTILAIMAPLLEYMRAPGFEFAYLLLRTSCHQIPGRCFWIFESNMGLCAKCQGFYLGQIAILIFLAFSTGSRTATLFRGVSSIFFLSMVLDSTALPFSQSNAARFLLGVLGGLGFSGLVSGLYLNWRGIMDRSWRRWRIATVTGICLLYALSLYQVASAEEGRFVRLRAGTPVMVELLDTVSSETCWVGQTVHMVVSRACAVEDAIVILANTPVYGKVTTVEKASGWGCEGKLGVSIESCQSVDGQEIMLSANPQSAGAPSHGAATALGVGAGVLCLPLALTGFAVKGDEGVIPSGMTIKARVDTDYKIAVLDESQIARRQKLVDEDLKEARKAIEQKKLEEQKLKEAAQEQETKPQPDGI